VSEIELWRHELAKIILNIILLLYLSLLIDLLLFVQGVVSVHPKDTAIFQAFTLGIILPSEIEHLRQFQRTNWQPHTKYDNSI